MKLLRRSRYRGQLTLIAALMAISACDDEPLTIPEESTPGASFGVTSAGIQITNLHTSTEREYTVDPALSVGDVRYIDRSRKFIAPLPVEILGKPYIRTANADRYAAPRAGSMLSFTVDQAVVVYVADDDRDVRPAWLNGWTDTGIDVHDDDKPAKKFSLFEKSFPKGTVTLGSNYWGDGGDMYTVFIAPAATAEDVPAVPSSIHGVATSATEVELTWEESTADVRVETYQVRRDTTVLGTVAEPTFTDTTVAPATAYTYEVRACDAAGQVCSQPATVSVTTPSAAQPLSISNLKVATKRLYQVDAALAAGDIRYIDRSTRFIAPIPAEIAGHAFIRTANADRIAAPKSTNLLSFDVNQDVIVYVADDDRVQRPAWLSGWTDTGLDLHDDDKPGKAYSLFKKPFPKGTVTLGSNYWGDGGNMYSVFIVPAVSGGGATNPEAPAAPDGLQVKSATASEVDIAWQPGSSGSDSATSSVARYRVYRDGRIIGRPTNTAYADVTVTANSTYQYAVSAVDSAGNESPLSPVVSAQTPKSPSVSGPLPAFPGAEGFGARALTSCRSKPVEILEVTNLRDSGPGSLRDALENARSDRFSVVVFRVAGYITTAGPLEAKHVQCMYIAGQTAPGDGITIRGSQGMRLFGNSQDVVIRHLRFRLGGDGIALYVSQGRRVMLDHVSSSWASGKAIAISAVAPDSVVDISLQRSLLSEVLSGHPTALQLTGMPRNSPPNDRISVHRNLLAGNSHRNPQLGTRNVQFVNNVVYNWLQGASQTGGPYNLAHGDFVNNFYRTGPMTDPRYEYEVTVDCLRDAGSPPVTAYLSGNVGPHNRDAYADSRDQWFGSRITACYNKTGSAAGVAVPTRLNVPRHNRLRVPSLFRPRELTAYAAEQDVISDVGANARLTCDGRWQPRMDRVDSRLLSEYKSRTGVSRPPSSPGSVGGYPSLSRGSACADSDHNGLPDAWENRFPNAVRADADTDGDGYLNIEEFLNGTIPN